MSDFKKIRKFISTNKNSDIKVPASLLGISNWNETYSQHIARDCSMSRKVITNKTEVAQRFSFDN